MGRLGAGAEEVNMSDAIEATGAGEMLHGTVALTLGDQTLNIELPEAALLFTH